MIVRISIAIRSPDGTWLLATICRQMPWIAAVYLDALVRAPQTILN